MFELLRGRAGRAPRVGPPWWLPALLLAGCVTPPDPASAPPPAAPAASAPASVASAASAAEGLPQPDAEATLSLLLAYHQTLRGLGPAELARELAELNGREASAELSLRKAMVLGLSRNPADLALVQLHLDSAAAAAPDARLRQFARVLGTHVAEQRRLADSLDRLGRQLKDSQRRNEQMAEQLEALKAIEQKLPATPGLPPAATGGGSAPPAR